MDNTTNGGTMMTFTITESTFPTAVTVGNPDTQAAPVNVTLTSQPSGAQVETPHQQ